MRHDMDISLHADIETPLEAALLSKADHFARRETDGIVVDLFWNRGDLEKEFRVEVEDRRWERASSSIRRQGEKRSRPSTTRDRRPVPRSRARTA
jgi:hypothetical protein